jgi:signal peptidase I
MFNKWRTYSFEDRKKQRHSIRHMCLFVAVFFVAFLIVTNLIVTMVVTRSDSMRPGIRAGDHFVFLSYGLFHLLPQSASARLTLSRGEVVLIDRDWAARPSLFDGLANACVRFFTAGVKGYGDAGNRLFIKRVIGLPGDTVSMSGSVVKVKPAGEPYTYTEFERAANGKIYNVLIPESNSLWDDTAPFSGNMAPLTLGPDECFVLSDDRSNTNDSRTWGPLPVREVAGALLFRYWPLFRVVRTGQAPKK